MRCSAGKSVLAIRHNGDVLPCNNFDTVSLGNIKKEKLLDIFNNSTHYEELNNCIKIIGSECETCSILDFCHGGCAMVSHSYDGVYNHCDVTRKAIVDHIMKDKKEISK